MQPEQKMETKLSAEVLQMLRNSTGTLEAAQVSQNALMNQIVALYGLTPEDAVDLETGEITRKQNA